MPRVIEMAETLAARVARLREENGWTQAELAERAGLTMFNIRQIEQGVTKNPRLDTLRALAKVFGLTLDEVAGE